MANWVYGLTAALAAVLFFFLNIFIFWFTAMVLVKDARLVKKDFMPTAWKTSFLITVFGLLIAMIPIGLYGWLVIALISLLMIKYFLGDKWEKRYWPKAAFFWLIWLIFFVLTALLTALVIWLTG